MKTMEDLFLHLLKDIYYAEKQILKALPKMANASENPELKEAFENHGGETEEHVHRLESIFEELGKSARGENCDAIMGLIEEGEQIVRKGDDPGVIDARILAGRKPWSTMR